jgi:3D (Asp-Asp-Asp) domain-containing protein
MIKLSITVVSASLILLLGAVVVQAADPSSVLIEVQMPDTAATAVEPRGWWSTLRFWLGARSLQLKPNPGTELTVHSSAYAPSPYQTDSTPCITASGTRVRDGVVATNFLPLGTVLEINGKRYIVEDRMNSRYSISSAQQAKYLDIWFASTSDALQFGRQKLKIKIIEYGSPGQSLIPSPSITPTIVVTPGPELLDRAGQRVNTVFTALTQFLTAAAGRSVNYADVDCSKLE